MKSVRSIVATLVSVTCVSLILGCAAKNERRSETLSEQELRILYPRQYLKSLDPFEREYVERRMAEEEREGRGK